MPEMILIIMTSIIIFDESLLSSNEIMDREGDKTP